MAPKSDKRTSEMTVISADEPNELQNRKLGSFITALMFSKSFIHTSSYSDSLCEIFQTRKLLVL